MGDFTMLAYHIVFSTKFRKPRLRPEFRERLFEFLGGIVRRLNGQTSRNSRIDNLRAFIVVSSYETTNGGPWS